ASPIIWYWRNALHLPRPPGDLEEEDREPLLADDLNRLALWDAALSGSCDAGALADQVELPLGEVGGAVVRSSAPELAHLRRVWRELAAQEPTAAVSVIVADTTITSPPVIVIADATTIVLPYPLGP